jgi:thiamine biosynthesis lipoprotein
MGRSERGDAWRVGIERPVAGPPTVHRLVRLRDRALATSGDYRNYYEVGGRRISHTIDPRTGRPVTHDLASVSVIAPLCVRADAIATALEVLGPDEGFAMALAQDWAALLVGRREDGTLYERETPAFTAHTDES